VNLPEVQALRFRLMANNALLLASSSSTDRAPRLIAIADAAATAASAWAAAVDRETFAHAVTCEAALIEVILTAGTARRIV
jgi:hypothetical protein